MNPKNDFFKSYDFIMLILFFCLMLISIVAIYSASKSGQYQGGFVIRQSVFYIIGLTISIFIAKIDLNRFDVCAIIRYFFKSFLWNYSQSNT